MDKFSFIEAIRLGLIGFRMRRENWPLDNWLGIAAIQRGPDRMGPPTIRRAIPTLPQLDGSRGRGFAQPG